MAEINRLSTSRDRSNGAWVSTQWRDVDFKPVAWWSFQQIAPNNQRAYADGRAQFWAPPRGYVIYVPQI